MKDVNSLKWSMDLRIQLNHNQNLDRYFALLVEFDPPVLKTYMEMAREEKSQDIPEEDHEETICISRLLEALGMRKEWHWHIEDRSPELHWKKNIQAYSALDLYQRQCCRGVTVVLGNKRCWSLFTYSYETKQNSTPPHTICKKQWWVGNRQPECESWI